MLETEEIVLTLEHLEKTLDELVMRGLSTVTPEQITTLESMQEECEKIGAIHISTSLKKVLSGIKSDAGAGVKAVMNTQASLRVFERLLTLEYAEKELEEYNDWQLGSESEEQEIEEQEIDEEDL